MKFLILLLLMVNLILAKKYERCELAKELIWKHELPLKDVGMLVCFAEYASKLEFTAEEFFIFGFFDVYNDNAPCGLTGEEDGICAMKCSDLSDDDITDDVKCVKEVLQDAGYDAWDKSKECLPKSKAIIKECFDNVLDNKCIIDAIPDTTSKLYGNN